MSKVNRNHSPKMQEPMASHLTREIGWFGKKYLSLARCLCGEKSNKGRPQEFCLQVFEALSPEDRCDHEKVVERFLQLKERIFRQQDMPTTAKAARFLFPTSTDLDFLPGVGRDWIPFPKLLKLLEPIFEELNLVDRALLGLHVHGWTNYQQTAGLFGDVIKSIALESSLRPSLGEVAVLVDTFVKTLITEITRRESHYEWVTGRLLARGAHTDFSTWEALCQLLANSKAKAGSDAIKFKLVMARALSGRAAYGRERICPKLPLAKFVQDCAD